MKLIKKNGGAKRDRTADLNTASDMRGKKENYISLFFSKLENRILLVSVLIILIRLHKTSIKLRKSYAPLFSGGKYTFIFVGCQLFVWGKL